MHRYRSITQKTNYLPVFTDRDHLYDQGEDGLQGFQVVRKFILRTANCHVGGIPSEVGITLNMLDMTNLDITASFCCNVGLEQLSFVGDTSSSTKIVSDVVVTRHFLIGQGNIYLFMLRSDCVAE